MKTREWVVLGIMNIALLILCAVAGGFAVYAYETSQPVPTAQIIEVPKIVEIPKIVEVEKIVEVIKTIEVVQLAVQNTNVPHTTPQPTEEPIVLVAPTKTPCLNSAWIIQQPKDRIQGSALKLNTEHKSMIVLENTGTCDWIGYTLVSKTDPMVLEVPVTYVGERVSIEVRLDIRYPMSFKWVMVSDDGQEFVFENGSYVDGTMNFSIDVYRGNTLSIPLPGGGLLTCGPQG